MSLLSYFWKLCPEALKLFATGLQCITSLVYTWYYFHLMFKVNSANISEGHPKSHQDYFLFPEKAWIKEQNELQIIWNYHKPSFSVTQVLFWAIITHLSRCHKQEGRVLSTLSNKMLFGISSEHQEMEHKKNIKKTDSSQCLGGNSLV